ncbi:hypothetical protein P167DRAFT_549826, partial [Morchella conica CCBAS932]
MGGVGRLVVLASTSGERDNPPEADASLLIRQEATFHLDLSRRRRLTKGRKALVVGHIGIVWSIWGLWGAHALQDETSFFADLGVKKCSNWEFRQVVSVMVYSNSQRLDTSASSPITQGAAPTSWRAFCATSAQRVRHRQSTTFAPGSAAGP